MAQQGTHAALRVTPVSGIGVRAARARQMNGGGGAGGENESVGGVKAAAARCAARMARRAAWFAAAPLRGTQRLRR